MKSKKIIQSENKEETIAGGTPLLIASQNGYVEIVSLLLGAEGIAVNKSNIQEVTPLYRASQLNHIEIVNYM